MPSNAPSGDRPGFVIKNPYTGEALARADYQPLEAAARALAELRAGLHTQARLARFERADVLRRLADLVARAGEKMARLVTAETGKTIRDSRAEVARSVTTLVCCAEEARRDEGEVLDADAYPPRRDKIALVRNRPVGVVLAITPFNFPVNIPAHKIGPAFAAGNTVIFKPAPQTYQTARLFVELCYEAGVPRDVLRLGLVDVPDLVRLVRNPAVDCVNFTGGTRAGHAIAAAAGMKKLLLEMGGNDPLIVLPDGDVGLAARGAVEQRFGTAGQRCTAPKRLFVHASVYDQFLDRLLEGTRSLVVGDPAREETDVGPVIGEDAAREVMAAVAEAVAGGARVLAGNRREGNVVYPTVLENVPDDARLVREETFGPVLPVRKFESLDDVVALVNGQRYGLQAGVFTNDLRVVKELFARLEVGALVVNGGPAFRAEHLPFGGVKDSGLGREGVRYAMREMSVAKALIL